MAQIAGHVECTDCRSRLGVPVIAFALKQPMKFPDAATFEVTNFIRSSEIPGLAATTTTKTSVSWPAKRSFEDFSKDDEEYRSSFISKSTKSLRIIDPVSGNLRKLLMMDNFPMSEGRRLEIKRRRAERHKVSSKEEDMMKEYDNKGEIFPQDEAPKDDDHDEEEEEEEEDEEDDDEDQSHFVVQTNSGHVLDKKYNNERRRMMTDVLWDGEWRELLGHITERWRRWEEPRKD